MASPDQSPQLYDLIYDERSAFDLIKEHYPDADDHLRFRSIGTLQQDARHLLLIEINVVGPL